MTVGEKTFTGLCTALPESTTVACLPPPPARPSAPPTAPPSDPRPAPPEEAVAACAGKTAGDTCAFSWKEHALSGACRKEPGGTTLVCAPLCPSGH